MQIENINKQFYIIEIKNEALSVFLANSYNLKHMVVLSRTFDSDTTTINVTEDIVDNILGELDDESIGKTQHFNPIFFPLIKESMKLDYNDEIESYDDLHPYTAERIRAIKNDQDIVVARAIASEPSYNEVPKYLN